MSTFLKTLCAIVLLVSCLNGQTRALPVTVAVTASDVEHMGGWPLSRHWYGVAIEKLKASGAGKIFFDIAFVRPDVIHPESDAFFISELRQFTDIYLMFPAADSTDASVKIFGTDEFSRSNVYYPFSSALTIEHSHVIFTPGRQSLVDYFIPRMAHGRIALPLPASALSWDYTFSQCIRGTMPALQGRDVVIYLDYPGVTSYIVTEDGKSFTATQIQLWTIKNIIDGNFAFIVPLWILICVFSLSGIPFAVFRNDLNRYAISLYAAAAVLAPLLVLGLLKMYVPRAFLVLFALPIVHASGVWYYRKKMRTDHMPEAVTSAAADAAAPARPADEVEQLRYQLRFYEQTSKQLAPLDVQDDSKFTGGLFYHENSPLAEIVGRARQVAKSDIPIMIYGESGTGKEKLAEFIHGNSPRSAEAFVAVNCASLNENLIESELFGCEKGAFTGAVQQKAGRFEMANGGTLFLDEIGETSVAFQVKLLRVLQEGVFERVGGTQSIRVSVRIIAATNRNIHEAIRTGTFREDLYYRLNGFTFSLPPLRERPADIEILFRHFLYESDPSCLLSEPMIDWLKRQAWKGNVRQLKSSTQRAVLNARMRNRQFLIPDDFDLQEAAPLLTGNTVTEDAVLNRLRKHRFKHRAISAAAKELGVHRITVTEYLRGLIIRYSVLENRDLEKVCNALRGDGEVENETQFRERIQGYVASTEQKIVEELLNNRSASEICELRFKGLPRVFEKDLTALIHALAAHSAKRSTKNLN